MRRAPSPSAVPSRPPARPVRTRPAAPAPPGPAPAAPPAAPGETVSPSGGPRGHAAPGAAPRYDVAVVTSAALPFRTGPAYFSLWHAGGLKALGLNVVYVVPWVEPDGQRLWGGPIYPTFEAQAAALAGEAERLGCPPLPDIVPYRAGIWWTARSVMPAEDVFGATPPADALVLHEPEHLAWSPFTRPRRRVDARTVLGIVMTNYDDYIRSGHIHRGAPRLAAAALASAFTRYHRGRVARHTDIAVPLSDAVLNVARGSTVRRARVTGVAPPFAAVAPVGRETRGIYFLGRLIWEKGLADVIEVARRTGLAMDVVGDGADGEAVRERAARVGAPLTFRGGTAAPWTVLDPYRVFFNPSRSEVLCTTTAEALVAGRHVVLPASPANDPFRAYPNTHFYTDLDGAAAALRHAADTRPVPPDAARRDFDWTNACRTVAGLCGFSLPASAEAPAPDRALLMESR